MTRTPLPITIRLDRGLLEHPQALHIRRMRSAVWLYLSLLVRLPAGQNAVELDTAEIASAMGLPDGTVRSWLGHLRTRRYVNLQRSGESVRVRIRHLPEALAPVDPPPARDRFFTIGRLEQALGEAVDREALASALDLHDDAIIKRALAGSLAVPAADIRRSRTALFLYLLKRHAQSQRQHDPRP
jgi:hypothetical protein